MHINFLIFPIIIILGFVLGVSDSPRSRKQFILIVTTILMLETSLRSLSVGSDTQGYYKMFLEGQDMSWKEIWGNFIGRYLYNTSEEDIGYLLMQKTISIFTSNWQLFVFAAQLTFFIPLSKLMYKYSTNMLQLVLAYILYVALFHIIALSGGRQLYSIGMTIMSFIYLVEKKYAKSILFIFLGAFIHLSCLLFLLPIILSKFNCKFLKTFHLVILMLVPLILVSVNQIIFFMGSSINSEKYSNYGTNEVAGGAATFIFLIVLSSVFCYVTFKKRDLIRSRFIHVLYTMVPLFTFFGPLIYSNGSMIRVSMYFHLYLMLLLPFAVDIFFNRKARKIIYFVIIVAVLVLSLRDGGLVYHFFWQEPRLNYLV